MGVDELVLDEIREHKDYTAWSAASKTVNGRPRPQRLLLSNAGEDDSKVLNDFREKYLEGGDLRSGIMEWSAGHCQELNCRICWSQANPAMNRTYPEEQIESDLKTDPPAIFRTEVLCQRVPSLTSWIDKEAWNALGDPAGSMLPYRGKVTAGIDVSEDGHVTMGIAMRLPDETERLAIAGHWETTEAARTALPELIKKIRPRAIGLAPGPAVAVVSSAIKKSRPTPKILTTGELAESASGLVDKVKSRQVLHPEDALLTSQALAAQKKAAGDSFRFDRTDGNVDAISAVAIAAWNARNIPVKRNLEVITAG